MNDSPPSSKKKETRDRPREARGRTTVGEGSRERSRDKEKEDEEAKSQDPRGGRRGGRDRASREAREHRDRDEGDRSKRQGSKETIRPRRQERPPPPAEQVRVSFPTEEAVGLGVGARPQVITLEDDEPEEAGHGQEGGLQTLPGQFGLTVRDIKLEEFVQGADIATAATGEVIGGQDQQQQQQQQQQHLPPLPTTTVIVPFGLIGGQQQEQQRQQQQQQIPQPRPPAPSILGLKGMNLANEATRRTITQKQDPVQRAAEGFAAGETGIRMTPAPKNLVTTFTINAFRDLVRAFEWSKTAATQNAGYLGLTSSLIDLIDRSYENGVVYIRELISKTNSADALAYFDYIEAERRKATPGVPRSWDSFHIGQIVNPILANLPYGKSKAFHIIRLNVAKRIVAQAVGQVLHIACSVKTYSNHIRLFPKKPSPSQILSRVDKYKPFAGHPDFNKVAGIDYLNTLNIPLHIIERGDPDQVGRWYLNGFNRDLYFLRVNLVENFMVPTEQFGISRPGFHHRALNGALIMGEGEIQVRYLRNTDHAVEMDVKNYSGISLDGLRSCREPIIPGSDVIILPHSVITRVYLNNGRQNSGKSDIIKPKTDPNSNLPNNANKILLGVTHSVLNRSEGLPDYLLSESSPDIEVEDEEEEEEEEEKTIDIEGAGRNIKREYLEEDLNEDEGDTEIMMTKEGEPPRQPRGERVRRRRRGRDRLDRFPEVPTSLTSVGSNPYFYQIDRSSKENSISNRFSFGGILGNSPFIAKEYLEYILANPVSLDLETTLSMQHFDQNDDISVYLEWVAYEAPPEHIVCVALNNVLISEAKNSINNDINILNGRIRETPLLKQGLKALFPEGHENIKD